MDRAFLCGINSYIDAPLRGCVNDITDMADFLVESCDFDPGCIRLLADKRATTKAILDRLAWLVDDVGAGDRIVFHFSGHGVQMPCRNPNGEVDGLDEISCAVDFDWQDNVIRDDDFIRLFSSMPKGVKFLWISDSCHSGDSTRDLVPPGAHAPRPKFMLPPPDIAWRFRSAGQKGLVTPRATRAAIGKVTDSPGVFISGCKSTQTSADAVFGDRPNGALTHYLLRALTAPHGLSESASTLVKSVRANLKRGGYTQVPQLEGDKAAFNKPLFG